MYIDIDMYTNHGGGHVNGWSTYWIWWFTIAMVAFLGPELYALASHHPENTLSQNVWRLEQIAPGQHVWQWTALHVLIGGSLALLLVWLLGHLVLGIWR
jgi:hypothetical protein